MKKMYKSIGVMATLLLVGTTGFSQMEFHLLSGFGTRFNDINSQGHGVTQGQYYDFASNTLSPMESEAIGLATINDSEDVSGVMYLDENEGTTQPAYRLNGQWYGIGWFDGVDPSESLFTTHKISENSQYVVGDMSDGCCTFGAFIYDTQSETLTEMLDTATTYRAYTVNSNGIAAGWLDYNTSGMGTLRQPMYRTADGEYHVIPNGQEPEVNTNQVGDINDNNVMVGDFDGQPFIYYMDADSFVTFPVPDGWMSGTFTSISENGFAVGYYQNFMPGGALDRRAIIYHPELGSEPLMLKDIVMQNGVEINTNDGFLGTAIAISADGQYVAGWVNGPPIFAEGWALYLGDLLEDAACEFQCPEPVEVTAEMNAMTAVVSFQVNYTCDETAPAVDLVQTAGLPSGSAFPIGTTTNTYKLINPEDSSTVATCSFQVIVHDQYCDTGYPNVEPITYVEFGDISNSSNPNSTISHEYFLDQMTTVMQNTVTTIGVQGSTGGNFIDSVAVFFDWDQSGTFEPETEMYYVGALMNSTGLDGQQINADILIPADATPGITRMRVAKAWGTIPYEPCETIYNYGQAEDYLVNIETNTGIDEAVANKMHIYPNVTRDKVRVFSTNTLNRAAVYSVAGQKLMGKSIAGVQAEIDLSSLAAGVYILNITAGDEQKSFKVVKE